MGYFFLIAAGDLICASSHRIVHYGFCPTSWGAVAVMKNGSMSPYEGSIR